MQKSTALLLIVALASAGVSAWLWLELRAERTLNSELHQRLSAAAATPIIPPSAANPSAEPATITTPVAAATTPATNSAPAVPAAVDDEIAAQNWQDRERRLMKDPRYREAFREQQRLRLATRRENFIRLLGFSPEQADAVIELSIDRQMTIHELTLKVVSAEDARLLNERRDAEELAYQGKVRDLLGEDKSVKWQDYMESRQSRMQVDELRMQLNGGDMLRDDQVEPLIAALHTERAQMLTEQVQMQKEMQEDRDTRTVSVDEEAWLRQFDERQAGAMKSAHKRMHSAAAGILSSSQLGKLDAMLKRDLEEQEARLRMAHIQSKLD